MGIQEWASRVSIGLETWYDCKCEYTLAEDGTVFIELSVYWFKTPFTINTYFQNRYNSFDAVLELVRIFDNYKNSNEVPF